MDFLQILVVAVVQGITEFLPISSSGHLALIPMVTNWPDQGLLVDVAVHFGTLGAVIAYLWRDVWSILGAATSRAGARDAASIRLLVHLVIATCPIVVAGWLFNLFAVDTLRNMTVIAWTTLGFGIFLYVADRFGSTARRIDGMTAGIAFCIGLCQILALVPGTSRAGVTITVARLFGFDRREAARFSMLLSIPTIIAAAALAGNDLVQGENAAQQQDAAVAALLAFVTALVAILLMMKWLRGATYTPFVVYRVLLGVALFALIYL